MTYDKKTRTIRIENGYWKPVAIFLRDGSEQVRGKKIGGYEILKDHSFLYSDVIQKAM
jgi:hypothetical protein